MVVKNEREFVKRWLPSGVDDRLVEENVMRAIVCTKYGLLKSFELKDVERPVPKDNEVLVEVRASSVTYSNTVLLNRKMFPLRLIFGKKIVPSTRIPGSDIAGKVVEIGQQVKQFKPGDEVYGVLPLHVKGGYAEYACAPEKYLASKPVSISFNEAAAMPESAIVALQGLRDYGKIQAGQKVMIYSASGGIGTIALQLAKYYGAEVTGVCSTRNIQMVRSLGADDVIDYTKEEVTKGGRQYDLIFAARYAPSIRGIKRILSSGGTYVSTAGPSPYRLAQEFIIGPRIFKEDGKKIAVIKIEWDQNDLQFIGELIESGEIRPVVDRSYSLEDIAEAFRYYSKGHAQGKVVVTMADGPGEETKALGVPVA